MVAVLASQKREYAGTAFHHAGLGEYAAKRSHPLAPPLNVFCCGTVAWFFCRATCQYDDHVCAVSMCRDLPPAASPVAPCLVWPG